MAHHVTTQHSGPRITCQVCHCSLDTFNGDEVSGAGCRGRTEGEDRNGGERNPQMIAQCFALLLQGLLVINKPKYIPETSERKLHPNIWPLLLQMDWKNPQEGFWGVT